MVVTFPSIVFSPGYSHLDSIRYGRNVYHLGFSYGAERGFDYNLYVYIVYECDSLGLICINVDNPYSETNQSAEIPQHNVRFIQQNNSDGLYVQVDDDLIVVSTNTPP